MLVIHLSILCGHLKGVSFLRRYFVIDETALPPVFAGVVEAKRLLKTGEAKNTSEATSMANISRSVFYKYKDSVHPFYDYEKNRILTIYALLKDKTGVLSSFLSVLAEAKANILTINQNIPVNSTAPITVSIETSSLAIEIDNLISNLAETEGVVNVDILAGE